MKFRENCTYALATVSSMGVRITPVDRQPVHTSHIFEMQATSAETNVLNVASSLGLKTKVLTRFVKDSAIASFIKSGLRGPRVLNDRAGEVGRTIQAADFDMDRIFGQEGVAILHLSGLIAALSPETTQACLEVARAAKKYGTRISFDLNFRASFWEGREEALRRDFQEIASLSDILIGNEEDFQLALGIDGPEAGGKGIAAKIDGFKGMIEEVRKAYPNVSVFATTLREVFNANCHNWGGIMLADGEWHIEMPREIQVMDRIGGGDGFVGGFLYGLVQGWENEKCLHFGWATGALAASMLTDYGTPADEDQVWSIYKGNARVKR